MVSENLVRVSKPRVRGFLAVVSDVLALFRIATEPVPASPKPDHAFVDAAPQLATSPTRTLTHHFA